MRQWLSMMGFALTLFWAGIELQSLAQSAAPKRGTPLQFSGRADATNTFGDNIDGKAELESLRDNLFDLSKPATPGGSMQGVAPNLTIRRPPPSKEARDLLDRRRNWMFASPESLPGGPATSGQSANFDELQKSGKLTAMEQYYLNMAQEQSAGARAAATEVVNTIQQKDDTADLPPSIRQREEELKRLLMTQADTTANGGFEPFSGALQRNSAASGSAVFLPVTSPIAETRKESPVDQYRQLLGLPSPSLAVADIFRTPADLQQERESSAPTRTQISQTPSTPAVLPGRSPIGSQPGQAPGIPAMTEIPRATVPSGTAPTLVKPEPPPRVPPPAPTFTAPRRMF